MEHSCPVLPDDIIEDIFTRLPARKVLECRRLSRAWASALSSDDFVDRHRRAANRHGGPRFFNLRCSSFDTMAYEWSPASPKAGIVRMRQLILPPPVGRMHGVITQQCRGLVLVHVPADHKYEVYNPSTGRVTALPPCHYTAGRHLPAERRYESLGIGYDARKREHKVVRIYYRGDKLPVLCEVYVIDDEGFWRAPAVNGRQLEGRKPAGWVSSYEASVFAQGHVHWMAQKLKPKKDQDWRVTRRGLIVSFSLAEEAFGVVPLPPRIDYLCDYHLTELEGRLCLFTVRASPNGRLLRPYDVWLLRDHETGTWDLRCRIDVEAASDEVAGFWGASPVACMENDRRILFMPSFAWMTGSCPCVYTPATGAIERIPSGKGLFAAHTYRGSGKQMAMLYEESVVSTGRPHEDILFSPAATQAMCVALACCLPSRRDLARLKLVCRSWRALIESKRFAELSAYHAIILWSNSEVLQF